MKTCADSNNNFTHTYIYLSADYYIKSAIDLLVLLPAWNRSMREIYIYIFFIIYRLRWCRLKNPDPGSTPPVSSAATSNIYIFIQYSIYILILFDFPPPSSLQYCVQPLGQEALRSLVSRMRAKRAECRNNIYIYIHHHMHCGVLPTRSCTTAPIVCSMSSVYIRNIYIIIFCSELSSYRALV